MMIYLPFLVLFFGLCGIPAAESTDTCHSCYQGKLFKDVFTLVETMMPALILNPEIEMDLATLKIPAESAKCLSPDNTVPTEECNGGKCMALSLNIPGIGNNVARACIPDLLNTIWAGKSRPPAPVDKIIQRNYEFIRDVHAGMTVTLPSTISADVKALADLAGLDLDETITQMKAQFPQLNYINQISGGKFDADLFIKDASAAPINVINTVAINSKTCQAAWSPTTCVSCFQGPIFKELMEMILDNNLFTSVPEVVNDMSPIDLNIKLPTWSEKCLKPDSTVATQERNGGKCVGFILTIPGIGVNVVRTAFPKINTNNKYGQILARYINDFHGSVEINLPESFSKFKEILKADFDVDIDLLKAEIPPPILIDYVDKLSSGKLSIDAFMNNDKCSGNGSSQVIGILYMIMLPLLIVLL